MEYVVKFFEYLPLYVGLVLVPAIIRSLIDEFIIKIPPSCFNLPSSLFFIKFEDVYASFVSTALVAPLLEEIIFRGAPYYLLGFVGLVIGNAVWVLAHPSWQLRYVSSLPLSKKLAFLANTVFYYTCASIFFTIPWMQGFGLLAIFYHMAHNGVLTLGGIFTEVELPAPWKKEDAEYFREKRGFKKKLEEKFFKDRNPVKEEEEEEEPEIEFDRRFFKEIETPKPTITAKTVAKIEISDDWLFWKL